MKQNPYKILLRKQEYIFDFECNVLKKEEELQDLTDINQKQYTKKMLVKVYSNL